MFWLACVRCSEVFDSGDFVPAWDHFRAGPICDGCHGELRESRAATLAFMDERPAEVDNREVW